MGFPVEAGGDENNAMQRIAVGELEMKNPALFDLERRHPDFLLHLTDRCCERRLTRFELPARSIDLPGAKAALLADQEDAISLRDETEIRPVTGYPSGPVER
jgi:hypothetical protein